MNRLMMVCCISILPLAVQAQAVLPPTVAAPLSTSETTRAQSEGISDAAKRSTDEKKAPGEQKDPEDKKPQNEKSQQDQRQ